MGGGNVIIGDGWIDDDNWTGRERQGGGRKRERGGREGGRKEGTKKGREGGREGEWRTRELD